jgi:hypothetical protein
MVISGGTVVPGYTPAAQQTLKLRQP